MNFFRNGKPRLLYVLALAQLVGGPLVLLQVLLFCKLTLHDAPSMGTAKAALHVWHSDEFQMAVRAGDSTTAVEKKTSPQPREPKWKPEKAKSPFIVWRPEALTITVNSFVCEIVNRARVWTPAWPLAPPGPPPRLG